MVMRIFQKTQLILITLAMLSGLCFTSCNDNDDDVQKYQKLSTVAITPPSTDSMKVTSSLKTYVFPTDGGGFASAITARMKNTATTFDSSVKTVIMSDNSSSMTDEDIEKIINLIISGGNVVYLRPTKTNFGAFCLVAGLAINEMSKNGEIPISLSASASAALDRLGGFVDGTSGIPSIFNEAGTTDNGPFCEAVSFRGDDFFITTNLSSDQKRTLVFTSPNKPDSVVTASQESMTDYKYGLFADNLAGWLNEQPTQAAEQAKLMARGNRLLASDEESSLLKLAHCQSQRFDIPSSELGFDDPIALVYHVWTVYGKETGSDYYLIEQEINAQNSKLNCGPDEDIMWNTSNTYGYDGAYGPYMSKVSISNSINADNAILSQPLPQNSTTTGFEDTHGFSWSINAGLILSDKPAATLGGSFTVTSSQSRHIPDLKATLTENNNKPSWTYEATTVPEVHIGLIHLYHSNAADILQKDCILDQSWIWEVPHASGTYTISSDFNFVVQTLVLNNYYMWYTSRHMDSPYPHTYSFELLAPPRAVQNWKMFCENASEKLTNFLQKEFPDVWNPNIILYTPTANDREKIDAYIAAFMTKMRSNIIVWKNNNFTGSYVFDWKLSDDPNIYKTDTLKVTK